MSKTQMVADPEKTQMVQPEKTIKVKILRDVLDPVKGDNTVLPAGRVVELPESHAKALLNRRSRGMYNFSGERNGNEKVEMLKYAEAHRDDGLEQA